MTLQPFPGSKREAAACYLPIVNSRSDDCVCVYVCTNASRMQMKTNNEEWGKARLWGGGYDNGLPQVVLLAAITPSQWPRISADLRFFGWEGEKFRMKTWTQPGIHLRLQKIIDGITERIKPSEQCSSVKDSNSLCKLDFELGIDQVAEFRWSACSSGNPGADIKFRISIRFSVGKWILSLRFRSLSRKMAEMF